MKRFLWVVYMLALSAGISMPVEFTYHTPKNGISSIAVSDSIIWAKTSIGVVLINTHTLEHEILPSFPEWPSGEISKIWTDSEGDPWGIIYSRGIAEYNDSVWTIYDTSNGALFTRNLTVGFDSVDNPWLGGYAGLSIYNGTSWLSNNYPVISPGNIVLSIAVDKTSNQGWIGTLADGLYRYTNGGWDTYQVSSGLASRTVRDIVIDDSGNKWIGTSAGITKLSTAYSWTTFDVSDGLVNNEVMDVHMLDQMNLVFATQGGVSFYNRAGFWKNYTVDEGLEDNYVTAVTADDSGRVWISTVMGLAYLDDTTWTEYDLGAGPANGGVRDILIDKQGRKWFATWGGGVNIFNDTVWTSLTMKDGLLSNIILSLTEDNEGNIWVGTSEGINIHDGDTLIKSYTRADGLGSDMVMDIVIDTLDRAWVALAVGGLTVIDGDSLIRYTRNSGLMHNGTHFEGIRHLALDDNNIVWLATTKGVCYLKDTAWVFMEESDGLPHERIEEIAIDSLGRVWMGTQNDGLGVLDDTGWTYYTDADGLPNNSIGEIYIDADSCIWVGTGEGLAHLEGNEWITYTVDDSIVTSNITAIIEERSGKFWLGTSGGMVNMNLSDVAISYSDWKGGKPEAMPLVGNPVTDRLVFSLPLVQGMVELSVMNIGGLVVTNQMHDLSAGSTVSIDFSRRPHGIYFCRIKGETFCCTGKFVK